MSPRKQDLAKAAAKTGGDGAVQGLGGAFVGGTIAGAIDEAQHLAGVGQADDQGMIAPGAVVGDVHALFAFGGGGHQGAVGIEDGLIEERAGCCCQTPMRTSSKMSCKRLTW